MCKLKFLVCFYLTCVKELPKIYVNKWRTNDFDVKQTKADYVITEPLS